MKKFYITTTLPYVNAPPHIGFALELVQADSIARYETLMGREVFFNTGTDEHGIKIYRKALEAGKDPLSYVDEYAAKFKALPEALGIAYTNFIRTTDPYHITAAQEFWKRCAATGDIYKQLYKVKYCVGCELEKTDSELVDGRCPIHPNLELELIEEENYFFRFSKYQQPLLDLYAARPDFVIPDSRFNEIKNFVAAGLTDFSVSRLKEKMPWGVPVPGDEAHVMYVWFDALVNYISTLGWPEKEDFDGFWPGVQIAGKDNLRQQSAMWQAMLMSAGLPPSKQILIHGFINAGGEKMSKSLGNVIDPFEVTLRVNRATNSTCGAEALRFSLLHDIPTFGDGDFTWERFKESYNANLANGLGNLVSRVMALAEAHLPAPIPRPEPTGFPKEYTEALEQYELKEAIDFVWSRVQALDERIASEEPFKVVKADAEKGRLLITELVTELYWIGRMLNPFMPTTNAAIQATVLANKKPPTLFPRFT